MTFFDIAMLICLTATPSECRDHRIQFESYGSLQECVFQAQFYIAQWTQANPEYEVKQWGCQYAQSAPDDEQPQQVAPTDDKS